MYKRTIAVITAVLLCFFPAYATEFHTETSIDPAVPAEETAEPQTPEETENPDETAAPPEGEPVYVTPPPEAQTSGELIVRVGLYYDSSALPGANLENQTGSGYRLGYFDENKSFVELARTEKTQISVVKNRTVYFNSGNYTDTASNIMVGAYSVELPQRYASAEEANAAAAQLRVDGKNAFATFTAGVFTVRLNSYASSSDAKNAAGGLGGEAVTGSKYCVSVVETGTNNILFQFDWQDNRGLGIMPSLGEVERPITWFKGFTYAGGFEYRRMTGNDLTVINVLGIQDYTKGVLPWEVGTSWPMESLKAQALCAKSYAYCNMNKHKNLGFDLCNNTNCQMYQGTKRATENTDAAVDQTNGMFVLYNGQVCNTAYHSSNGGSTENSENVWYEAVPYLRAVPDPYEDLDTSSNGRWSYTVTNAMLTDILNAKDHANSGIVSMTAQYTAAGNVLSLTMTDSSGKQFTFSKEKARTILNSSAYNISVYSQRFTISSGLSLTMMTASGTVTSTDIENIVILGANGQTSTVSATTSIISEGNLISSIPQTAGDGTYVIQGTGWGHNLGMSQNGAKAMAAQGFTYEEILKYYFTGVTIGKYEDS